MQGGLTQRTALFNNQQLAVYGDGMAAPLLSPTYEAATNAAGGGTFHIHQSFGNTFNIGNRKFGAKIGRAMDNAYAQATGIRPGSEIHTDPTQRVASNAGVKTYTVMAGDTLRSIAQSMYGTASLWWKIADANGLQLI